MLKRNISIYITDVTMVRHNVQELLAILEEAGVNYSMNIETEEVPEVESDMAEEHTWEIQTDDEGNPILPEATFTGVSTAVKFIGDRDGDVVQKFTPGKGSWVDRGQAIIDQVDASVGGGVRKLSAMSLLKGGVPVVLPSGMIGDLDRRIGTADVYDDGTAVIRMNARGEELMTQTDVVNLSISAPGPAKRAN